MNRDKKLIEKRNEFIIETVNKSKSVTVTVLRLSEQLYITERRIYQVLKNKGSKPIDK